MSDRIDALEQTVEQLADAVEELREENQELREENQELREELEELREELEEYRTHNEKDKAMIRQDVTEVHEQNGEPTEPDEPAPEDPPIYDVIQTPTGNLEPRERRTAFLWKDLTDYTKKCPAGRVITNPELRRVLAAGEPDDGATIDSTIAYRVMDLSEDLTRGAVEVEKEAGQWRMVIPSDWKDKAREAYRDAQGTAQEDANRSDSAVS